MQLSGRIVEEQKNYYIVDTEQGNIRSVLKGNIKKEKKRLYAGDFVDIEVFNKDIPEGIIRRLYPRKNNLQRPAVANIDQIVLVNSFKMPPLDLEFIDFFLFYSAVLDFSTILIFNKSDLLTESDRSSLLEIIEIYEKIGYSCIQTSALTGKNINLIAKQCENRLSILAGPSGSGKSTILARIFPDCYFRTNELSKSICRGKHTTTNTTLLKLIPKGYIADTPGFSHIHLPEMPEEQVVSYFPDIASKQGNCRFSNCIHDNEPGCAVKEMVDKGEIMGSRYKNYLKIYRIMEKKQREYRKTTKIRQDFKDKSKDE